VKDYEDSGSGSGDDEDGCGDRIRISCGRCGFSLQLK